MRTSAPRPITASGRRLRPSCASPSHSGRRLTDTSTRAAKNGHVACAQRRPRGAAKGAKSRQPLGLRWPGERTNAWLANFGPLRPNSDRRIAHRLAEIALAVVLIVAIRPIAWAGRHNCWSVPWGRRSVRPEPDGPVPARRQGGSTPGLRVLRHRDSSRGSSTGRPGPGTLSAHRHASRSHAPARVRDR